MSLDDFLVTERTAPLSADMRRKMAFDLIDTSVGLHSIVVACMTDADLIAFLDFLFRHLELAVLG
jgi:hypothetical protein